MELLLCVSQQTDTPSPYRFSGTGIQVYSFEEAVYHVYHYWKQSVDDITSPGLANWVHDTLGMSYLSARIKEAAKIEGFSQRMLAFLRIIEYISEDELLTLKPELERWETRLEWETYKERADDLVARGDPDKAVALYRRALQYDENPALLNNMGVAYMQIEAYREACRYLSQALKWDDKNPSIWLHYIEALILAQRFEEAENTLTKVISTLPVKESDSDILYLRGELAFGRGKYQDSLVFFDWAITKSPHSQYVFRQADVYAKMRQFDRALHAMARITKRDIPYFMKEAELHASADNMPAAIKSIERALALQNNHTELWVRLARYHRLDYNLPKANTAISKALSLDANNERARLESARIKKGMGNTKEYQSTLNKILTGFKGWYRDLGM